MWLPLLFNWHMTQKQYESHPSSINVKVHEGVVKKKTKKPLSDQIIRPLEKMARLDHSSDVWPIICNIYYNISTNSSLIMSSVCQSITESNVSLAETEPSNRTHDRQEVFNRKNPDSDSDWSHTESHTVTAAECGSSIYWIMRCVHFFHLTE